MLGGKNGGKQRVSLKIINYFGDDSLLQSTELKISV